MARFRAPSVSHSQLIVTRSRPNVNEAESRSSGNNKAKPASKSSSPRKARAAAAVRDKPQAKKTAARKAVTATTRKQKIEQAAEAKKREDASIKATKRSFVFVGNLDRRVTSEVLHETFGGCGEIRCISFAVASGSPETQYAIVTFKRVSACRLALAKNGVELLGRPMTVNISAADMPESRSLIGSKAPNGRPAAGMTIEPTELYVPEPRQRTQRQGIFVQRAQGSATRHEINLALPSPNSTGSFSTLADDESCTTVTSSQLTASDTLAEVGADGSEQDIEMEQEQERQQPVADHSRLPKERTVTTRAAAALMRQFERLRRATFRPLLFG